ncbi:MAG: PIG-L family deacetylase, partial [Cyclobacteriaceae bacterium]
RFSKPWLVQNVLDWTPYLIKKAVINLCETLNKPILKLTDRDYNDHGLSDLLAQHGSAYQINIQVFNELQHTLTGWPGGKPNADDTQRPERNTPEKKRVVIFSPHPDDDVISMGGTFARLHDQGHDVHVVYQTSGNIAVFDDDVIRYADFVTEYHESFGFKTEKAEELFTTIRQQIADKKPGETDSIEVQKIKALIRRAEARAGARYIGLSDDHIHFMDLPFYETGTVKKKPFGIEDIKITKAFLEEVQPHQIYAAGDLSDPHGTHRVCLEIIKESLGQLKNQQWMKDCWVWLYRGAWQEWEMENIEMAVPLSPDELLRKRRAIFKHQSQKDRPLFPGSDSREFWQRAEERNRATAENYNRLGLAEYEAIEAFKKWQL